MTDDGAHACETPATFEELADVLSRRLASMSRAQKAVGQRILSDPEGVAFMTVTELAQSAGVNEATVVRVARSLGFDGYPGLVKLCRVRLQSQAQLIRRFSSLESLDDAGRSLLEVSAQFDQANIARSMARIDEPDWERAVAALAESLRVHIVGMRKCAPVAGLLGYLLDLVRDDVRVLHGADGSLTDQLRDIRAGDCVVAVSIQRYARATVEAFSWAAAQGASTIALTDNPSSPLTHHAQTVFYVETTGASVMRSVTALVTVVQTLASATAASQSRQSRRSLETREQLLESFDVYHSE
ncbi:MurR/RpiR family transcriptional regulator [Brevibacterium luteolum]|uniref:MurR/RpiR family transcriptional regulator n=1 Tax=Brevibacterium luteolum TaxID=199591 RepID=UPI003B683BCE